MSFTPRVYIDPDQFDGLQQDKHYSIPAPIVHYLGTVLRLVAGGQVVFFNERDGEWDCEIEHIHKGKGSVVVKTQLRLPIIPFGPTLIFSPLKRDATDLAIRMATELGVSIIQPVHMVRTNSRRIKEDRFRSITIEAAEQSNRLTIPEIRPIMSLDEFCEVWPKNKKLLVACERCEERHIMVDKHYTYQGDEGILIGPEGGFDINELKKLFLYDFVKPLSLGDLILRAETAIAAGLAQLFQYVKA